MKAGIAQSGRTFLAVFAAISLVLSLMAVYATPAEGQQANPSAECGTDDDGKWNGEFWKIQINEGSEGEIESNVGNNAIDFSLSGSTVTWTNNHENAVFRIVRKAGQTVSPNIEGLWETGEGGSFTVPEDISHVTFCFTDEEAPEPGVIIVEKEVTEDSDTSQSFEFTADYDSDGFSLADGEQNNSGELAAGTYAVSETVPTGWTLESATCDDDSDPSSIDLAAGETVTCTFVNDETPPPPPEPGEIIVQKFVDDLVNDPQGFAFRFNTTGFTLGDNTLAHGESSSSGDLEAGNYSVSEQPVTGWTPVSATCDDGSDPSNIDLAAGETVTCTFVNTILPQVGASIVVTVDGVCEVDGDEGQGIIDVEISVDGGADVVISDSDGDVIETLTSSGTVTVPEGATYTWEATPNEGFEFPAGSETSGSITIETCSDDPETLPFTGLDTGMMSLFASALLGGGLLLVSAMRRQEEA